ARDPPMAAQSEFEAAAQRCAVDGGDDRLAGCLHSGNEFAQQRTNLGLGGIELPYVRTAGKEPARTGQHNGLDRVVGQCGGQPFSQRHAYLAADAVNGRIVDTEHGNAGLPDLAQVQVHHGQPSTRTSACPSSTSSPSTTRTSTTLPPRSASTGSSIFMDSIFTISLPSLFTWQGCTSTLITRPATVASITCMMCSSVSVYVRARHAAHAVAWMCSTMLVESRPRRKSRWASACWMNGMLFFTPSMRKLSSAAARRAKASSSVLPWAITLASMGS